MTAARQPVKVVFRKYDGALHWHFDAVHLGEDADGVWVGFPAGTLARRGSEPAIAWQAAGVLLLPRDGWWAASFNAAPHRYEIYIDISTPPLWTPKPDHVEVSMVDLDLDVARMRGGEVRVLDEDEFAEHRLKYGYPVEVVDAAQAATEWLAKVVGDGTEPFAAAYHHWLGQVS